MTPDEIGKSYDSIADRWLDEEFPVDNGIEQHRRAMAFVKHRGNALDIGCGSSGRLPDLFLEYGFAVEAVDISERMIELAKPVTPQSPSITQIFVNGSFLESTISYLRGTVFGIFH